MHCLHVQETPNMKNINSVQELVDELVGMGAAQSMLWQLAAFDSLSTQPQPHHLLEGDSHAGQCSRLAANWDLTYVSHKVTVRAGCWH